VRLDRADLGYDEATILHDVGIQINPGDLVAVAGPNGSGKTTLFRTILGFLPVLSGSLTRACPLNEFGYVPQSAALDAAFPIKVREIVEMGAYGPRHFALRQRSNRGSMACCSKWVWPVWRRARFSLFPAGKSSASSSRER
jgi:ABC-type Mn2+/Zn2+ transport system ATPase subunit